MARDVIEADDADDDRTRRGACVDCLGSWRAHMCVKVKSTAVKAACWVSYYRSSEQSAHHHTQQKTDLVFGAGAAAPDAPAGPHLAACALGYLLDVELGKLEKGKCDGTRRTAG